MYQVITYEMIPSVYNFDCEQDQIDFYNLQVYLGIDAEMVDPE
jgi:hypothetical protein